MNDIRRQLFRSYPITKKLLNPTIYIDINSIKKKEKYLDLLEKIRNKAYLAKQYTFLAALCNQDNLYEVELSIIKNGSVLQLLKPLIDPQKKKISKSNENQFQNSLYQLFKYYRFPLIELSKSDMLVYAKKNNFDNLLEMTWFCATPKKGKPCGFCGPCIDAIKMGFGRRVPAIRRVASIAHLPIRSVYREKIKKYS
jgi:hypothetical protein